MNLVFLVAAVAGGGVLALQLLLGLFGLDHHDGALDVHAEGVDGTGADALHWLSVRVLASGALFFGLAGLTLEARGASLWLALPVALVAGVVAAYGVALLMRWVMRLESDGTARIEEALGLPGTVYLSIPGERAAPGKVTLALAGRTMEVQAVAQEALPTGAAVVVVDVLGPDMVEVAPTLDAEDLG